MILGNTVHADVPINDILERLVECAQNKNKSGNMTTLGAAGLMIATRAWT